MSIELNSENYYSQQSDIDYMSASQFKAFAGTPFTPACEYDAYMQYKGLVPKFTSKAMTQGSYVDAALLDGDLDDFKAMHPEMYKKTGDKGLLADYKMLDVIVEKAQSLPLFMEYLEGDHQKIATGEFLGTKWKGKLDVYKTDERIVDLKCMRDVEAIYSKSKHCYVDFVRAYGYDIQGAIYQKLIELETGKKLPFYLAVLTKENVPDAHIIEIPQDILDGAMKYIEENITHVLAVKNGLTEPTRCGKCGTCKGHKTLAVTNLHDMINRIDAEHPRYFAGNDKLNEDNIKAPGEDIDFDIFSA